MRMPFFLTWNILKYQFTRERRDRSRMMIWHLRGLKGSWLCWLKNRVFIYRNWMSQALGLESREEKKEINWSWMTSMEWN